ncbi:uncharacterized protein LOC130529740 [Takifugu flavidus]|uniref:Taste receptor type 2 n=1 Tax=Takifugu flavidus TaxID=433684 RepID=A0A5C6PQN3_9TELE|nr:uncharacterized protein LOC130529740 [Takifugu flavidus]TWW80657.1 hypothetical protein D4764_01G0004720 [Takifugu flavidus]
MERRYIEVERWLYQLIIFPLSGINFFLNIFYIHCLISNRQKLRQPLKLLLCFLIGCSAAFSIHLALWSPILVEMEGSSIPHHFFWMMIIFFTHSSMTCSGWMSIYAYVKVVPSKRALLIWIKRNIKSVVYLFFFSQETLIIFEASLKISTLVLEYRIIEGANSTSNGLRDSGLEVGSAVVLIFLKVHLLSCIAMIGMCNFSMAHYLLKHIKSITREGFSTSGIHDQMQIVISEFFQGAFFLMCSILYFVDTFSFQYSSHFFFGSLMALTITLLYMTGTTASLFIGQVIFRQGAVGLWKWLTAPCCANI